MTRASSTASASVVDQVDRQLQDGCGGRAVAARQDAEEQPEASGNLLRLQLQRGEDPGQRLLGRRPLARGQLLQRHRQGAVRGRSGRSSARGRRTCTNSGQSTDLAGGELKVEDIGHQRVGAERRPGLRARQAPMLGARVARELPDPHLVEVPACRDRQLVRLDHSPQQDGDALARRARSAVTHLPPRRRPWPTSASRSTNAGASEAIWSCLRYAFSVATALTVATGAPSRPQVVRRARCTACTRPEWSSVPRVPELDQAGRALVHVVGAGRPTAERP